MSNSRENREQDARAGTFDMAQATASGGMVAVVAIILLASWFLKAEPRRAPAAGTVPPAAAAPSPPAVLAPLVASPDDAGRAADLPLASPPVERERSNPLAERALRDAARLAGRRGAWTAQVAAVCNEGSVAALLKKAGDAERLYLLPVTIAERSCFRVLWGTYDSAASAAAADVPAALGVTGKPRVLTVSGVLP